ncbi:Hypothetical protein A7982_02889 [Minicystis rosea]|nr:Hypothetical protein A7982_02889 [Minicystis rosea]
MKSRSSAPEDAPRLLGAPAFHALRDVLRAFARGGMPSRASRTPDEDARLAVFQTLNELVLVLDQFRRRAERGEAVRLLVTERAREMGRAMVEIAIVHDDVTRR